MIPKIKVHDNYVRCPKCRYATVKIEGKARTCFKCGLVFANNKKQNQNKSCKKTKTARLL